MQLSLSFASSLLKISIFMALNHSFRGILKMQSLRLTGSAGVTPTSCLTLSSVLESCCWMSSSSSVRWLLFISSALFEHKDALKTPSLKRMSERITQQQQQRRRQQRQQHRSQSTFQSCRFHQNDSSCQRSAPVRRHRNRPELREGQHSTCISKYGCRIVALRKLQLSKSGHSLLTELRYKTNVALNQTFQIKKRTSTG